MQKVEGSSPFSRFVRGRLRASVLLDGRGTRPSSTSSGAGRLWCGGRGWSHSVRRSVVGVCTSLPRRRGTSLRRVAPGPVRHGSHRLSSTSAQPNSIACLGQIPAGRDRGIGPRRSLPRRSRLARRVSPMPTGARDGRDLSSGEATSVGHERAARGTDRARQAILAGPVVNGRLAYWTTTSPAMVLPWMAQ